MSTHMFQTTLITEGTREKRYNQVQAMIHRAVVSVYDQHTILPSEKTNTISISQIRSLITALTLSPVHGLKKVGIIYELQHATTEAQNALLKLLEEPDETTILIATATRKEEILPTIVSRCRIMTIPNRNDEPTQEQIKEFENILRSNDGERLEYAERLASESRQVEWVTSSLDILHRKLLTSAKEHLQPTTDNLQPFISTIRTLDRARITLEKTNTNQRLLMENLLLSLDQMPFQ